MGLLFSAVIVATAIAANLPVSILAQRGSANPRQIIGDAVDVEYLERLATSSDAADRFARPFNWSPKSARSAAYIRLGAIGTRESLAAVERIERAVARVPMLEREISFDRLVHPADHVSDYRGAPAVVEARDGRRYSVKAIDLYGPMSLFLRIQAAGPRASWSRPLLAGGDSLAVGGPWFAPRLSVIDEQTLRVDFDPPASPATSTVAPPPSRVLAIAGILKDTDGDGWTDLEEQALGLNPSSRDSDSDGQADGQDICPLYAPTPDDGDEDAQILRRAIFAVFGISESPWALFVNPSSRKLQLVANGGPVIFDRSIPPRAIGGIGVYVSWTNPNRTGDIATVSIHDWEGNLAASHEVVTLRRVNGEWYVVGRRMVSIS